jgi:hypothetical protein
VIDSGRFAGISISSIFRRKHREGDHDNVTVSPSEGSKVYARTDKANSEALTGGSIGLNIPILPGTPREVGIFFYLTMWALVALTFALTVLIAKSKFGFSLH